jgi:hypothetical protein
MPETAQRWSIPHSTSAPCRPGAESIVEFSEIFLLGSRGARTRVLGAGWLASATTARRVKAWNETSQVEPKKNLVPKLDTALTTPQLRSIFCILHTD